MMSPGLPKPCAVPFDMNFFSRLDRIENILNTDDISSACAELIALLVDVRERLARFTTDECQDQRRFITACGRFSNLYARLICDPRWDSVRDPNLPALLFELPNLFVLVSVSPAGTLDQQITVQAARFKADRTPVNFLRWLLLWTPSSVVMPPPFQYVESAKAVVIAQALATVSMLVCCDARADVARHEAIALLASTQLTPSDIAPFVGHTLLASAWMRCSYASAPCRHDIKVIMNLAIASVVGPQLDAVDSVPEIVVPAGEKPILVAPLEWAFGSEGAMYRCYAPVLMDLRRHFRVVGLGERRSTDDATVALFDAFVYYEDLSADRLLHAERVAAAIRALRPTVIFYPSIGMLQLVICLANLRLAPVQIMTIGHPASSRSPQIDYVITERSYVGDETVFSERPILVGEGALAFDAPPNRFVILPDGDAVDVGVVQIAVPAVAHKLSWSFLRVLQIVAQRAGRPIRFYFFSGLGGATFLEAVKRLTAALPGSAVYPMMDYDNYNARVARCHLHAASFPFGGTNSLIDSLRHGLPVVALRGREVHECIDAEFVRRLDMEQDLVANNEVEYIAILLRLIDEPDFLARMQAQVRAANVEALLMSNGKPELFSDAIAALAGG